MNYNAKNYTEQGGDKTVIGGTLEIKEGAILIGLPTAINQADSTATTVEDLVADFIMSYLLSLKMQDLWNQNNERWR